MTLHRVIAIDGPAASGKSTVAKAVARREGMLYVDSGALYRGITLVMLKQGLVGRGAGPMMAVLLDTNFEFLVEGGAVIFRIAGETPGAALRTDEINRNVSVIAACSEVRDWVVSELRGMRRLGPLVMEGRDIGTHVFPDSPHKFYLDASPDERARRRHREAQDAGSVDAVEESLRRRDQLDSARKAAPLRVAADAIRIDSTGLTVDEVVDAILSHVHANPL